MLPLNKMGFNKLDKEDYGQTLGNGELKRDVICFPVLGPTTIRDTTGSLVNFNGW